MKKLAIIIFMVFMVLVVSVPAFAHVHLFNPSDECSGGKAPLGLNNPAGNDAKGTPQAADVPATGKCLKNR